MYWSKPDCRDSVHYRADHVTALIILNVRSSFDFTGDRVKGACVWIPNPMSISLLQLIVQPRSLDQDRQGIVHCWALVQQRFASPGITCNSAWSLSRRRERSNYPHHNFSTIPTHIPPGENQHEISWAWIRKIKLRHLICGSKYWLTPNFACVINFLSKRRNNIELMWKKNSHISLLN